MYRVKKEKFFAAYVNKYEKDDIYISVADCPNHKTIFTKDFKTEEEAKKYYEKEKESVIETKQNKELKNHIDGEIISLVEVEEKGLLKGFEALIESYLNENISLR